MIMMCYHQGIGNDLYYVDFCSKAEKLSSSIISIVVLSCVPE